MKKKSLILAGVAAMFLAACTNEQPTQTGVANDGNVPVGFYTSAQNQNKPRRAQSTGIINNTGELQTVGSFGVFAYYTDQTEFDATTSTPNFMYNQKVTWDGSANWEYQPVMYWPNEWAATVENNGTTNSNTDRLSFFAYAPYIDPADLPATPSATDKGVLSFSANDAAGAPVVEYRCVTEGTGVDLMWGVANADYYSRTGMKTVDAGFAFKDLVKPEAVDDKIPFHFRHALARFDAKIALEVDNATYDAANTKVTIEEVEILSADGSTGIFNTYGKLSLDNEVANEPKWTEVTSDITSYSFKQEELNEQIRYVAPTGTQSVYEAQGSHTGVLEGEAAAIALTETSAGAMFIPGNCGDLKVRVKYHVTTKNESLAAKCADVVNDITSAAISSVTLEAGKRTVLNIMLSLRQVMVNASVEEWEEGEEGVKPAPKFSVSASTTVEFALGNLQYDIDNSKWQFASTQYEVIGNAGGNVSKTSGVRDLFGWGTGSNPTLSSTNSSDYATFTDWGTNDIDGNGANYWRTLTKDEWVYLFQNRTNASSLYGLATVGSQTGVVILPDDWTLPTGSTFNAGTSDFSENTYTIEQWAALQLAGAVFLPAAGYRNGTYVSNVGGYGYYWSSTEYSSGAAYDLYFNDGYLYPLSYDYRFSGYAVRLVH